MRVTANLLKPQMNAIKKQIYLMQKKRVTLAGQRVAEIATSLLKQTFRFWNQSGENKFSFPVVKSKVIVTGSYQSKKLNVSVYVVVIDPTTQKPHFLWHILDGGRKSYIFPVGKRSPVLKKRKRRRTKANKLQVDPFPGFTGEKFVIHGGTKVDAVEGNNWYKTASEQTLIQMKTDPLLSSIDWVIDIIPYSGGT